MNVSGKCFGGTWSCPTALYQKVRKEYFLIILELDRYFPLFFDLTWTQLIVGLLVFKETLLRNWNICINNYGLYSGCVIKYCAISMHIIDMPIMTMKDLKITLDLYYATSCLKTVYLVNVLCLGTYCKI